MISLNTNILSQLVQRNMKDSTNQVNLALERLSTGFRINHAKDDAAGYSIANLMDSKLSSYQVAEENVSMGLDLVGTAEELLSQINNRMVRLRALQEQAANGTYSADSLNAINAECNAILDEISRIYSNGEYNGLGLFQQTVTAPDGSQVIQQNSYATRSTTLKELSIGDTTLNICDGSGSVIDTINVYESDNLGYVFDSLQAYGFTSSISNGRISIKSSNDCYVAGDLADELGITTTSQEKVTSTTSNFNTTQEVVTQSTTLITETTTTTTSTTTTNTIYTTETSTTTTTSTIYTTTTIETTRTTTTEVTTTTYVSETGALVVGGTTEFLQNPYTYTDEQVAAMTPISSVSSFVAGETYSISTPDDLKRFQTLVNSGKNTAGCTFVLANDIVGKPTGDYVFSLKIGGSDKYVFQGTFDGNGHVIKSNKISSGGTLVSGFFMNIGVSGVVKNVGLVDCSANVYNNRLGFFAYDNNGTITNCYVKGAEVTYNGSIGIASGFVYRNNGSISNCYAESALEASVVAGFTSGNSGSIDRCYFQCSTTSDHYSSISASDFGNITNCYSADGSWSTADWDGTPFAKYATLASPSTTLADLGLDTVTSLTLKDNEGNTILTANKDYTLQMILDSVNAIDDFTATLNNGVLNITTVGDRYLDTTSDLFTLLPVTTNTSTSTSTVPKEETVLEEVVTETPYTETFYTTTTTSTTQTTTTYETTTTTTTRTETLTETNTVAATGATTFGALGLTSSMNVTVARDGTKSTINVGKNTTLDDFYTALAGKGITATTSGGVVTLAGSGNSYIDSANISDLLGISAVSKNTTTKTVNNPSSQLGYTKTITGVATVGTLGLQVGINADEGSRIEVDVAFNFEGLDELRNIGLDGNNYLEQIDEMIRKLSVRQTEYGAAQNRLESVLDSIQTNIETLTSSLASTRDADIAKESTRYLQQQILQNACATLLSTANQTPNVALALINGSRL